MLCHLKMGTNFFSLLFFFPLSVLLRMMFETLAHVLFMEASNSDILIIVSHQFLCPSDLPNFPLALTRNLSPAFEICRHSRRLNCLRLHHFLTFPRLTVKPSARVEGKTLRSHRHGISLYLICTRVGHE